MKPLFLPPLVLLFSLPVLADIPPVEIGPAARLAAFHTGAPGNDSAMAVFPRSGGFTVVTQHRAEIRSIEVDTVPPPLYTQPRVDSQKHLLEAPDYSSLYGMSSVASTARGLMIATNDPAGLLLSSTAEGGTRTRIGGKTAAMRAFGCNALRCVVQYDQGDPRIAILDDTAHVVEDFSSFDTRLAFSIAADPTGFLMLYSLRGEIRARRLDLGGATTFDVAVPYAMAATFAGDRYEVVTRDDQSSLGTMSLSLTGQLSPLRALGMTGEIGRGLACNDEACIVLEETIIGICDCIPFPALNPSLIHAIRFNRNGSASPKIIDLATDQLANVTAGIAWNGNAFYAAWTHSRTEDPSTAVVRGALISPSGDVLSRDGLSASTLDQTPDAVARHGGITVAAWSEAEQLTGITELHVTRLDAANVLIDDRIIARGDSALATSIVPLGTDFLVLWNETHGAIVRADGSVSPVDFAGVRYDQAAASRDHWLLTARGSSGQTPTALLTRAGMLTPRGSVPAPYNVTAMASDGDHFALLGRYELWLLDGSGNVDRQVTLSPPGDAFASDLDFAGGVYAILYGGSNKFGGSVLERFDRDGQFLGATFIKGIKFGRLSHVGNIFVVFDGASGALVSASGNLTAGTFAFHVSAVARTDQNDSVVLYRELLTSAPFADTYAAFTRAFRLREAPPHRAVRH